MPADGTIQETKFAHYLFYNEERMMELELMLRKTQAETKKILVVAEQMRIEAERKKK